MKFTVITTMAIMALMRHKYECEASSTYNSTIERQPGRTVEIIELMLPRNVRNGEKKNEEDKKHSSDEEPRYEIFIKPHKNRRDMKGSPKIKIFVETEEYDNEKSVSKLSNDTFTHTESDGRYTQPSPLVIKSVNSKTDSFQHQKTDRDPPISNVEYGVAGERVNSGKSADITSSFVPEIEKKNIPSSYASKGININQASRTQPHEINTYRGSPRGELVLGDKGIVNLNKNINSENVTPKQETEIPRTPIYTPLNYKSGSDAAEIESHRQQHRDTFNTEYTSQSSSYHKFATNPSDEKVLVYEPEAGISAKQKTSHEPASFTKQTQLYPSHAQGREENRDKTRKQVHDLEYDETGSSGSRRPTNQGETRRTIDNKDTDERTIRESVLSEGTTYHQSGYSDARPSDGTNGGGSKLHSTGRLSDEERSDPRYDFDEKTIYGNDRVREHKYPYTPVEDSSEISSTGLPYETVPVHKGTPHYESANNHPMRQNVYSGFPESHTGTVQETSRPTPYEGPNTIPGSSCPSVFKYTTYDEDRWFADIYVTTDEVLTGMRLDITLSSKADLMTADAAEVKSTDNTRFTVLSLKKRLIPGPPEIVQIMVKFNTDRATPYLQAINLNGRLICPSRTNTPPKATTKRPEYVFPGDIQQQQKKTTERYPSGHHRPIVVNEYASTTLRTTPKPTSPPKRTTLSMDRTPSPNPNGYEGFAHGGYNRPTTKRPISQQSTLNFYDSHKQSGSANTSYGNSATSGSKTGNPTKRSITCGKPAIQARPLITHGQKTTRGQWPWHVALYRNIGPDLNYSCGGTLITDFHVLTAAHCVTMEDPSTPVDPKIFLVFFGKYFLYVSEETGVAKRKVSHVTVHPEYTATTFRSDIALLTLSSRIEFTDFIRPICLWDKRSTRIDDIVGLQGTVVGWGYDEKDQLTKELREVKMPVVKHDQCLWSYPNFYPRFTSNTTYCAGFKNGTSVCNGDSGGGMFFPITVNREERWFLRGLVSISPARNDANLCDIRHYVVFTDVAKYLTWIENLIY